MQHLFPTVPDLKQIFTKHRKEGGKKGGRTKRREGGRENNSLVSFYLHSPHIYYQGYFLKCTMVTLS